MSRIATEQNSNDLNDFFNTQTKLWQGMFENHTMQQNAFNQMQMLAGLYAEFVAKIIEDPGKIAALQMKYWQAYWKLCTDTFQHTLQEWDHGHCLNEDNRFANEDWHNHPYFKFLKDFYLMTAHHIQETVSEVDGIDPKTHQKLNFYTRQFLDALAPSNFPLSNPEVLRKTIETRGQNLLRGMTNLIDDLKRSDGYLKIKMTDLSAFQVGKNLAVTPGKVVFQNHLIQLIQYAPTTDAVSATPFLMIPPWINKYYILDLSPERSYVKWIVDQGISVFMISWINPDERHKDLDFEDYMSSGVLEALDFITQHCQVKTVNALGFCIGGTLLGATLAYLAKIKDHRIKSATYLATLLDFSDPGDMAAFIDESQIKTLEVMMAEKGYLDGGHMSVTFNMLRANDLIWSYFIKNYLLGEEPFPFDMLFWNSDSTNMPAKMHSTYLRNMYLNNLLAKPHGMKVKDESIDLCDIKIPCYFLSTHYDHIAPWVSTYKGALLHSGPTTFVLGGSGHIAGVMNHPSKEKYGYRVNDVLDRDPNQWFEASHKITGSWWPHWMQWLKAQSGDQIPARPYPEHTLEDAPGTYVARRL